MQVFILCGGLGERMGDTSDTPKPLIKINQRPLIEYTIDIFKNIRCDINLLCGHGIEHFESYFINKRRQFDSWRIYIFDTGLLTQTGSRVKMTENFINDDDIFIVTYSDGISNLDISNVIKFHKAHGRIGTIVAVNPKLQFGLLKGANGCVTSFQEKPIMEDMLISGGFFIFNKIAIEKYFYQTECSLEDDVLPTMALDDELMYYKFNGYWQCVDTKKDVKKVSWDLINELQK